VGYQNLRPRLKRRIIGRFDDTKQGANSLGLQVQSVVARVNFPHEETWGLYQTLGEQSKKLSLFKQPVSVFCVSPPPPLRNTEGGLYIGVFRSS
jgi:hypothetical protein